MVEASVSYSKAGPDDKHVIITAEVWGSKVSAARKNLEYDVPDVYLFEPDYTIAGSTGFLLWPGSLVLLELLRGRLAPRVQGCRIIELGSGIGLAGLCAAAAGAHTLLTDLPSVVDGILNYNISRNEQQQQVASSIVSGKWGPMSVPVGQRGGSALSMALDWSLPLEPQAKAGLASGICDLSLADMLVACDVVWLKELLIPFRDTVLSLLQIMRPGAPCLLTFLDRAKAGSLSFSSRGQVLGVFEEKGCNIQVYHSEAVEVDGDKLLAEVIEISLPCKVGDANME